jgi:ABC-type polysaccharide/polyol phosphate transport system ATPase subunit
MSVRIRADRLCLDVPVFLQRERHAGGWTGMLFGAAFDPPRRSLVRLLDEVSFEVGEGDRVAILGRNGAGKSTLLRVLNRVYQPTRGHLQVDGSCQALLNMSLGFNPEATVRENIHLRGIAMGLRSSFLRDQIGPILEFSGLQEKANHRLRTLSSGQKMRLGFAISTSVQHDIILMDEWVGAGDADFMAKARERMRSRVGGSKIVMLASHSVGLLREVCNKGIVLERGRLRYSGDIVGALSHYHELMANPQAESADPDPSGGEAAELVYGAVEQVAVEPGVVRVDGWCVDTRGRPQVGLMLEVGGLRCAASAIERLYRPDVVRHLGLSDGQCGFRARFEMPEVSDVSQLGPGLRLLAGDSPARAHSPLRIAPAVAERLRGASRS